MGESVKKKRATLVNFELTHLQKCPICKKAKTARELCPKAYAYIHQDHKYQKELTGYKENGPF
jgi:hypothetical protein